MAKFENNSDYYYSQLKDTDRPGNVMASFYCVLYNVAMTRETLIMCNKLLKVFGRFTVFFSLVDMYGSYPQVDEPYKMWYTICRRKFEAAHGDVFSRSYEPLDTYLSSIDKELAQARKRNKKLKIPPSEGLE